MMTGRVLVFGGGVGGQVPLSWNHDAELEAAVRVGLAGGAEAGSIEVGVAGGRLEGPARARALARFKMVHAYTASPQQSSVSSRSGGAGGGGGGGESSGEGGGSSGSSGGGGFLRSDGRAQCRVWAAEFRSAEAPLTRAAAGDLWRAVRSAAAAFSFESSAAAGSGPALVLRSKSLSEVSHPLPPWTEVPS